MSAQKTVRALVVDDHPLFRQGIVDVLDAQPDFVVVGQAGDGTEALVKARELRPDLVVMDIVMPGSDGVEATRRIKEEMPDACVVMLTVRDDDASLLAAIEAGAQCYVLKTARAEELLPVLRGALRGESAIPPALMKGVLEELRRLSGHDPAAPEAKRPCLTGREREVLALIVQGATDKEIAQAISLSLYTVKDHVSHILRKLGCDNRYEAAHLAKEHRLV
jgi:DNA-binding NarL/FixJ family response regulator